MDKKKTPEELIFANKELINESQRLQREFCSLEASYDKKTVELAFQNREKEKRAGELIIANKNLIFQNGEKEKRAAELIIANKELIFQNGEKGRRADELIIANKELAFQNEEKEKRAKELIIANKELAFQNKEKGKRAAELIIANKELAFQNWEKESRAVELIIANKELAFQNAEKEKRADELIIANKELAFQNEEKEKRAAELIIANKELAFQDREKEKRADELIIANKELAFQNEEKQKRADELIIANKELAFQNEEKEKRAAELIIANKELVFQNREKEVRADELMIANKELAFQNEGKGKRAKELIIANKELAFQNEEKEKRAAELIIANNELVFQNREKEKRADELMIANKELAYQNREKERRAAELVFANKEIARKITERKLTKDSLRNALSLIDATLKTIHNGILVVSRQGVVIKYNAKFVEMWHISGEVLASENERLLLDSILGQLVDPDGFLLKVTELYRNPKSESLDYIPFKDGRVFERISQPMYLEGKPKGRVWSFMDITGTKQLEKELNEVTQQLVDVKSIAKVGSWETDLSNNAVRWSEEAFRIFELNPDSFKINHPNFLEYIHPEDLAIVDAAFKESLKNISCNIIQYRIVTPGGVIKSVEADWRIIYNDQGQAIRALGTCLDVTKRYAEDLKTVGAK